MLTESGFAWQYRSLIEYYRLTPELSVRQRERILDRFLIGERGPGRRNGNKTAETPEGEQKP